MLSVLNSKYDSKPLLDNLDTTPSVAYSIRQLKASETVALKIGRASDGVTQNIGFINGIIDIDSINTFASGTTANLQTWVDQGDNNDIVETTNGNRATFVQSFYNNRPAFKFTVSDTYPFTSTITALSDFHAIVVVQSNAAAHGYFRTSSTFRAYMTLGPADASPYMRFNPTGVANDVTDATLGRIDQTANIFEISRSSGTVKFYINGVLLDSNADANSADITYFFRTISAGKEANVMEALLYNVELSSEERNQLLANQSVFYGIPTYQNPERIKTLLQAGQSNAEGGHENLAPITSLPANLQLALHEVFIYNPSTGNIENLEAGVNNEGRIASQHGIEITMGYYYRLYAQEKVCIIKLAVGGTGFIESQTPDNWRVDDLADTNLLQQLYDKIESAKSAALNQFYALDIKALIWFQGEKDGNLEDTANAWKSQFTLMLNNMRSYLNESSKFLCVLCKIHNTNTYHYIVRNAQEELARDNDNIYIIDTDSYSPTELHLNSSDYQNVGKDVANLIKYLI